MIFLCFKEDCAWVRTLIYSTVYLSTILNFVVTKWTSCAVYGAVLSHNLCVHYWFVIVRSVINPNIISDDFFHKQALRPCLFAHIDLLSELSEFCFLIFIEVLAVIFFVMVGCRCQIACKHLSVWWEVRAAQSSTDTHHLPPLCFHLTAFPPSCQWLCFASNIHILKHCSSRLVPVNMSFFWIFK